MADLDRARLRELAENARDADDALERAESEGARQDEWQSAASDAEDAAQDLRNETYPERIIEMLDALDAAERERDALAADARRWQAIDAHWRTAQCYFRKDATNSIRAVQMFIDFDHRNDGKALGGVVDEAIAALAAREPT